MQWLVETDMPYSIDSLIESGQIPKNFDLELARQEYKEGIGPYRGGTTTGAPADWGDSGKPNKPEYETPITSDKTFEAGSREELEEVVRLTNKYRKSAGLTTLSINEELMDMADTRAEELQSLFDHVRPNGEKWYTIFEEVGSTLQATGENAAKGPSTAKRVAEGWYNSEGHRANMMNSEALYIGVARNGNKWIMLLAC